MATAPPVPPFVAACIQMCSGDDPDDNLSRAGLLLADAAKRGAQLAALPEFFCVLSADEKCKLQYAEEYGGGKIQNFLRDAALQYKMHILGGALPIRAPKNRVYAASLLYAPDGAVIARYDKMHLFRFDDIDETKTIAAGNRAVAADTALGRMALSVCYDIRFPELYRSLAADIIFVPSAFTPQTGKAHWQVLLRARAIENLAHIIAPAQCGMHSGGRCSYGTSMIIDPWGEVLAFADGKTEQVITASICAKTRQKHRTRLPALSHRRL